MKSPRPTNFLAFTLLLSLVILSSETVRAASIVRSGTWIGQLPEPKGLNAGTVKVKRPATNHWVRFEAPAVSRRGTLTLSSNTLQFIRSSVLGLATVRTAEFLVQPLTLADVEIAGSLMSNFEVASVEDGSPGTFTLPNTSEFLRAAAVSNQLPFEQSIAADFAIGGNLERAVAPNSISTVASSAAETPITGEGHVPVPEPSVVLLSALAITGLFATRRRR